MLTWLSLSVSLASHSLHFAQLREIQSWQKLLSTHYAFQNFSWKDIILHHL